MMRHVSVITSTIMAFLELHAAIQPNVYVDMTASSDMTCSGSDVLFTKYQITKIRCSLVCEHDDRCSGFTYRISDGKCVGCQGGGASVVFIETGMKYFVPRGRIWGTDCTSDHVCNEENQQCMEGACVCTPGYSFQEVTWSCVDSCASYGDSFQAYASHRISGNNEAELNSISLDDCLELCRSSPTCRSTDFSTDFMGDTRCNIQSLTARDIPSSYELRAEFVYYNRNCQ